MLITLTTDFGLRDPFVGIMKGVILARAPQATLVDLCHEIPAQDVVAGALALEAAVNYFPPETLHLAVVDPGVGSARRPIAVRTNRAILIGPDNGLLWLALTKLDVLEAAILDRPAYHLTPVSTTFHGRDIFAPAAGHVASGVPVSRLGTALPVPEIQRLELPPPKPTARGLDLRVLAVDRFGNLVLNVDAQECARVRPGRAAFLLDLHGVTIKGPCRTFSEVPEGHPLTYYGSTGRLEIAVRNGNAAAVLGAQAGDLVHLT